MVYKVENYTGATIRIVSVCDGKLVVKRCYVSRGRAVAQPEVEKLSLLDGVELGIMQDMVSGLPPVQKSEINQGDSTGCVCPAYIVRKSVAMAMLQMPPETDRLYLLAYDPVLVPRNLYFEPDIDASKCEMLSGLLSGPAFKELQAMDYVCYGYQRLVVLKSDRDFAHIIFSKPTAEKEWLTAEERREDFRQTVVGLRERFNALPEDKTLADLKTMIAWAEANDPMFNVDDAKLSQLLLMLERAEQKARKDTEAKAV